MASTSLHIAFSLLYFVSFCKSDDRIVPGTPLSVNDMLISDGGAFALGFFSPTNTNTSLYVGIWYNNIPLRTVVWVANRNNPITDPSSATLAVTRRSGLVLSNAKGRILWTTENNITGGTGATAQLLNSGNLVLRSTDSTVVWQSFDHPTDTLLPGMRLRLSYNSHISERLVSWKGPDDPATGDFSLGGDPSTYLQLLAWRGSAPYWRSAVWNGATAFGVYQTNTKSVLYQTVVDTGDEIYMTFSVSDGAPSTQFSLDYSGTVLFQSWNSNSSAWMVLDNSTTSDCDHYGSCGPFGYCDHTEAVPTCKCLEGFEPNGVNFSKGCRRNKALNCGDRDYFLTLPGMKVPDKFLHVRNKSFDQCAAGCSSNCSCTGYAYANLSSVGTKGDLSRCLLWMGELIDTEKVTIVGYRSGGENLYLRLARLPDNKGSGNVVKIVLPVAACLLVLTCMCIVWIYKCRGKRGNKETKKRLILGDLSASEELRDGDLEFPFISFEDIVAGTDNFSDSNMLGHGGFGKVYKAMLEDAKEVAVKRLSKGSGQGIEEFRNEVVLIAKLQHKNLVKLVGCCIHGDEKLLIYEYLPNKSLDAFLFNTARKPVLNWPTRLKIIKGIARGLLYLHQDSRLTIIHRDLKASNILLDLEMSPKISDFGMARIFGCDQQQANTNRVVGTYGYMSPEYAMNGTFSIKSDTYSFGVLLLEIISGLKISSTHLIMDFFNLIAYAWSLWKDGKAKELVDSSIVESCSPNEVLRCIHIGLLCVQDNPNARPLMSSVVFMLENETTRLPSPKQPIYFVQRNYETEGAEGVGENNEMCDLQISINNVSVTMLEGR